MTVVAIYLQNAMVIILIVNVFNIPLISLATYVDNYIWRVNCCIGKYVPG